MIVENWLRLLFVLGLYVGSVLLMVSGMWFLGLALHTLVVGAVLWGTLNPSSGLFGSIQTKTDSAKLWLTLDDGPDPETTPEILKILGEKKVQATFFLIGEKAERYPELVRDIVTAGHQIANHTQSHPQASFWCKGPARTQREIETCQSVLEKITGTAPNFFRAPVGHHNLFVHPVLKQNQMRLIGWSCRGFDAVERPLSEVMELITKQMQPNSIILAHEATAIASNVVAGIIDHAEGQGWSFINPLEEVSSQR